MHKLRGVLRIIIAATLFGFLPICVKLAFETGMSVLQVNVFRFSLATVMLSIIMYQHKIHFRIKRQQIPPLLLALPIGFTGANITLSSSYNYISSGVATSLHYLYPVFVMLIAYFIYHEKLSGYKWFALLISLNGIYLIADPLDSDFSLQGVILAIGSAIFFVIYVLLMNHHQLKNLSSIVLSFYSCLVSALSSFLLMIGYETKEAILSITFLGFCYMIMVSFFCTVLAMIFFIKGIQIIGSGNASILSTLEPVVSLIAGVIILGESLTLHTVFGCLMIVVAVTLIGCSKLLESSEFTSRKQVKRHCINHTK